MDHQFAASSTARFLSALRRFYQYLNREKLRSDDPTVLLEGPTPQKLPSDLSRAEVEALLHRPGGRPAGTAGQGNARAALRHRAAGVRAGGADRRTRQPAPGLVRVVGRATKERLVPMGEEGGALAGALLPGGRTCCWGGTSSDVVFSSKRARMMTRQGFMPESWHQGRTLSPHPAVMPSPPTCSITAPICECGCPDAAGPRGISTTQIYTHVANRRLKALHGPAPPRA